MPRDHNKNLAYRYCVNHPVSVKNASGRSGGGCRLSDAGAACSTDKASRAICYMVIRLGHCDCAHHTHTHTGLRHGTMPNDMQLSTTVSRFMVCASVHKSVCMCL